MSAAPARPLLPRQEAFCRHIASGRSLAGAARLSGYAWGGAKQQGSALMRDARVAARVVELSAAREAQRQAELAWVVARAKRAVESALAKGQEGTVLRGLDRVVAFQGLMDGPLGRVSDLDLADPDGAAVEETGAGATEAPAAMPPERAAMPPERAALVEPSPDPRLAAAEEHAGYVARLRAQAEANAAAIRARIASERPRASAGPDGPRGLSEPQGPDAADGADPPPAMPPEGPAPVEPLPDLRAAKQEEDFARLRALARADAARLRAELAEDARRQQDAAAARDQARGRDDAPWAGSRDAAMAPVREDGFS